MPKYFENRVASRKCQYEYSVKVSSLYDYFTLSDNKMTKSNITLCSGFFFRLLLRKLQGNQKITLSTRSNLL